MQMQKQKMFQLTKKSKTKNNLNNNNYSPIKKQSKFSNLYDQIFRQVKKKIPNQLQNFPLIQMKSYQLSHEDYFPQKKYQQKINFQSEPILDLKTLKRQKSMSLTTQRNHSCINKKTVNKMLWEKKMSLQTLRISSSCNKFKKLKTQKCPNQEKIKTFRIKSSEQNFLKQDDDQNAFNHFSILPLNLNSSKQDKQKFIANKKKIQERFKMNFSSEKDKKPTKINFIGKSENIHFWETQRQDNQFINFVKDKISVKF